MPHKTWAIGEEVIQAEFQPIIADQIVAVFASAAARTAGWAAPPVGAAPVLTDNPGAVFIYDGTTWQRTGPQKVAVGRTLATGSTWINNTAFTKLTAADDQPLFALPFTKRRTASRLIVSMAATLAFNAGNAQLLYLGVTPDNLATSYTVVQRHTFFAAPKDIQMSGFVVITGLAAGTYTFEPCMKASTAAHNTTIVPNQDQLSISVEEWD